MSEYDLLVGGLAIIIILLTWAALCMVYFIGVSWRGK